MSLLAPFDQEAGERAIRAATRPNGSVNFTKLIEIAAMMRVEFEQSPPMSEQPTDDHDVDRERGPALERGSA